MPGLCHPAVRLYLYFTLIRWLTNDLFCDIIKYRIYSFFSPKILAYGTFNKGTYVWHGQKTTPDRAARGGHLQVIKSFYPATTQCCINQQFTNGGFIPNTRCTNNAEIGAHVYFNNDEDASAKICQIIPTCNRHNNVFGNAKRGQNFRGQGVEVVDGTPFIVRLMDFEECEKKRKRQWERRRQDCSEWSPTQVCWSWRAHKKFNILQRLKRKGIRKTNIDSFRCGQTIKYNKFNLHIKVVWL